MKLQYITGCIAEALNVDGKPEIKLTDEERLKVIDQIHLWFRKHPEYLNELIQYLTTYFGDLDGSEEPCECCGDFIDEYTLDL